MQESEILEIRRGKSTLNGVCISFGLFGSASTAGYVQGELGHGYRGHGHHHLQQHPQIVLHACHSDNFKDNELLLRWQHMRSLSSSLPTTWSRPPQGDFLLSFLLRFLQIMQEMRPIQYACQFSLAHPNNWRSPPATSPPPLCLRRPRSSFLRPGKGRCKGESFICVSFFFHCCKFKDLCIKWVFPRLPAPTRRPWIKNSLLTSQVADNDVLISRRPSSFLELLLPQVWSLLSTLA